MYEFRLHQTRYEQSTTDINRFYCFKFNSNKRKMKQTIVGPSQFEHVVSFQIVRRFISSFKSIFQLHH